MRFTSLGSGSRGNALLVEAGRTRVLLDCGFGPRELEGRLTRAGVEAASIAAVLVTHEHSDHVGGVRANARRHGWQVFLTHGTWTAMGRGEGAGEENFVAIDSHDAFAVGDLQIHPFPVPHDAREPVQYVFSDGARRLGVLTDAGCATDHMAAMLGACDGLVLECNHDKEMLRLGSYPWSLKQRVGGRFGHLDNDAAAELLGRLDNSRLQHLVAAHLSEQNNTPALARAALAGVLGCAADWIEAASQDAGFAWRTL